MQRTNIVVCSKSIPYVSLMQHKHLVSSLHRTKNILFKVSVQQNSISYINFVQHSIHSFSKWKSFTFKIDGKLFHNFVSNKIKKNWKIFLHFVKSLHYNTYICLLMRLLLKWEKYGIVVNCDV